MKTTVMKIAILGIIFASAVQFLGATVWEGVSSAAVGRDLPGTYSVATNSFPRNTVVEITNLENGKKVRAIVVFGLDSTGLLAVLSQNAADSIGLQGNFTCRIRMTQAANANASSIAALGPIGPSGASPSAAGPQTAGPQTAFPQSEPEPIIGYAEYMNGIADAGSYADTDDADDFDGLAAAPYPSADSSTNGYTGTAESGNPDDYTGIASRRDSADTGYMAAVPTGYSEPVNRSDTVSRNNSAATAQPPATQPPAAQPANRTDYAAAAGYTAAVPYNSAETAAAQPPAAQPNRADYAAAVPANRSDSVSRNNSAEPAAMQPATQPPAAQPGRSGARLVMLPSEERLPTPVNQNAAPATPAARSETKPRAAAVPPANFSPFQAPLISSLEQGKWYVQLAAYKRVDHVEDEISRIGTAYPVAVQNVGTDTNPMFRILLGPLNQGESGAMLQRVKSIGYADAFVRHN